MECLQTDYRQKLRENADELTLKVGGVLMQYVLKEHNKIFNHRFWKRAKKDFLRVLTNGLEAYGFNPWEIKKFGRDATFSFYKSEKSRVSYFEEFKNVFEGGDFGLKDYYTKNLHFKNFKTWIYHMLMGSGFGRENNPFRDQGFLDKPYAVSVIGELLLEGKISEDLSDEGYKKIARSVNDKGYYYRNDVAKFTLEPSVRRLRKNLGEVFENLSKDNCANTDLENISNSASMIFRRGRFAKEILNDMVSYAFPEGLNEYIDK